MHWLKDNKWPVIIIGVIILLGLLDNPEPQASNVLNNPNSYQAAPTQQKVVSPKTKVRKPSAQTAAPTKSNTYTAPPTQQPTNTYTETKPTQTEPAPNLSNDNYYTNTAGNTVHSPAYSNTGSIPAGASARCRDSTYSFSQSRRGTCSHHGGVAEWL
jgi:hypothetical protein